MPKNPSLQKKWWRSRRAVVAWCVAGVLTPAIYLVWLIFGSPEAIRISWQTTRITEPVTTDGYVDYLSLLRQKNGYLSKDDYRTDPWFVLFERERTGRGDILYLEPVTAFTDSLSETIIAAERREKILHFEEEILPNRTRVPFSASSDPLLANVIDANAAWYDAIQESFQSTALLGNPKPSAPRSEQTLWNMPLPMLFECRQVVQRFLLRSMYRAGENDVAGAFRDIQFAYQVAARMDQPFLVGVGVATAMESNASQAAIHVILSSKQLTPEICLQIEQLPQWSTLPTVIENLDESERYVWLDMIQGLHAGQCRDSSAIRFSGKLALLKARRLWHAVDWNRVLERQNQFFDATVAAASLPTWQQQNASMSFLLNDSAPVGRDFMVEIDAEPPWSAEDSTERLEGAIHSMQLVSGCDVPIQKAHLRDLRRRIVQIVARLSQWRQLHGEFPKELQSVLVMSGFSDAERQLIVDPFTGVDLGFQRVGEGFVLTSLGPNMEYDGEGFEESTTKEVDLRERDRSGDDHIWRWPPAE